MKKIIIGILCLVLASSIVSGYGKIKDTNEVEGTKIESYKISYFEEDVFAKEESIATS